MAPCVGLRLAVEVPDVLASGSGAAQHPCRFAFRVLPTVVPSLKWRPAPAKYSKVHISTPAQAKCYIVRKSSTSRMPQLPFGPAAAALFQTWVAVLSLVSFVFCAAGFIELQDGTE